MFSFIDLIFHLDNHLASIIQHFGLWTYLILFAIVFAETGLVVTPFLPGDSLLFVVGAFSAIGLFQPLIITTVLILAAVIGDSVNYAVGKYLGRKLVSAKKVHLLNKERMDKTHQFFKKYGGKTIILARFIPMVRTFAPFVAGFIHMDYPKFLIYNVAGGILWVTIFTMGGFFFGNIRIVKENFSIVILVIIIISLLPAAVELIRAKRKGAASRMF